MALFGRPSERDDRRAREYRHWLRRQNPLAVASFVLGAFSLTHLGTLFVDAAAAIVLGTVALAQLRRAGGERPPTDEPPPTDADAPVPKTRGRRLAWGGIVLSIMSLVAAALVYAAPWKA